MMLSERSFFVIYGNGLVLRIPEEDELVYNFCNAVLPKGLRAEKKLEGDLHLGLYPPKSY